MGRPGSPRCPLAPVLLPFLALLATAGGQGPPKCREQAVVAGGELWLLLEKPSQGWEKVDWRVRLDTGEECRILSAKRNKSTQFSNSTFLGRAFFQPETLSLRISRVTTADSGVYLAEFQDTTGVVTSLSFCVSVWEPLRQPLLETHILHREQDRCDLSLLCTVPGATSVSYSWSCTGGHPGALGHQPQLDLQVPGDSDPTLCSCNATNPVSWRMATTDVTAACHTAPGILLWLALAVALLLALAISVAICYWRRKRKKEPPAGQVEQTITVYEEVGKTRTGQPPPQNRTSETTVEGNTIYAVITKTQGPSRRPESETCTIYSMIQPGRRSPSLKRKRLDRALVSTAYVEVTSSGPVRR